MQIKRMRNDYLQQICNTHNQYELSCYFSLQSKRVLLKVQLILIFVHYRNDICYVGFQSLERFGSGLFKGSFSQRMLLLTGSISFHDLQQSTAGSFAQLLWPFLNQALALIGIFVSIEILHCTNFPVFAQFLSCDVERILFTL